MGLFGHSCLENVRSNIDVYNFFAAGLVGDPSKVPLDSWNSILRHGDGTNRFWGWLYMIPGTRFHTDAY